MQWELPFQRRDSHEDIGKLIVLPEFSVLPAHISKIAVLIVPKDIERTVPNSDALRRALQFLGPFENRHIASGRLHIIEQTLQEKVTRIVTDATTHLSKERILDRWQSLGFTAAKRLQALLDVAVSIGCQWIQPRSKSHLDTTIVQE
jgi:hypothetical protein